VKRPTTARWFWIAVVVYAVVWSLTYLIGASQVRRQTLATLQVPASFREVALERAHSQPRTYACEVTSYAPFLLTARYAVYIGDEAASGGTGLHFWFGIPSRPIYVYQWAV
jgi:hypothetical protein